MKTVNSKILTLIFSTMAIFALSGCGSSGTSSSDELVGGTPVAPPVAGTPIVTPSYEITAHHDSTVVVHSHVTPSPTGDEHTHQWTQVSGPTVALTTPTVQTTTFVMPAVTLPPVDSGKPQVATPYEITAHHGSEVVVHSQVTPSPEGHTYTHTWTQVSGPTAALTTTTGSSTGFVAPPAGTTQPVVLQHTVINKQTGQTTKSQHTVKTVPATPDLSVVVSKPVEIVSGKSASLNASASGGDGTYTYLWTQVSGSPVTLIDNVKYPSAPTFVAPLVSAKETLEFTVTVTDGNGKTVSATETITVIPAATTQPIVLQHVVNNIDKGTRTTTQHKVVPIPKTILLSLKVSTHKTVLSGSKVSLHASASGGDGKYTYVWTQVGVTTVNLDNTHPSAPTFTAPSVTTTETLTFSVMVTDGQGNTERATETITVTPPQSLAVTITASPTTITDLETSKLTSIVTGGVTPYTYQWKPIFRASILDDTSASATLVPTRSDTQSKSVAQLIVTDSKGDQVTSGYATIIVNPGFFVEIAGPQRVHNGDDIHLTSTVYGGSGGGYEYEWKQENSQASYPNTKDLTITPSDYGNNPNAVKFFLRAKDLADSRWSVQDEIVVGFY